MPLLLEKCRVHKHYTSANFVSATARVPPTVSAVKNPSSKIVYDEYNHQRFPPGDPSKRAFAYLASTGGRFVYASLVCILVLKFVLSMSASKDVLALASLEVDLSSIEPGTTDWEVVWIACIHHPSNRERVKSPEWLIVIGICTHLGCIPLLKAGYFGGWFVHAMVRTKMLRYPPRASRNRTSY